ncbi:MAG: hypothetical protein AAF585_00820 [Verrucomicrobiota bacterium]
MNGITWICAILLIAVGSLGYFGWELIGASKQSVTAAIPAFVGILVAVGALIALKSPNGGMWVAFAFAALGLLAGLGRIIPVAIKGKLEWGAPSTLLISAMSLICLAYVVIFFIARRG